MPDLPEGWVQGSPTALSYTAEKYYVSIEVEPGGSISVQIDDDTRNYTWGNSTTADIPLSVWKRALAMAEGARKVVEV